MADTQSARPVAVITGASSGIGAVYAERLAARGFDLILVARRADRLNDAARRLAASQGIEARALVADLSTDAGIAAVEAELSRNTRVSMLVNNAGLVRVGPFATLAADDHRRMLVVNVMAPSLLARAVLPGFLARGAGTIINIGSANSVRPYPGTAVYSGSKAFVLSLSLALRDEVAGTGVRLQAVLPAATATEIWDGSGFELKDVPANLVMPVEAMVDAALAGLDRGEDVTLPSVPDSADWDRYDAASVALFAATQTGTPAARYRAA